MIDFVGYGDRLAAVVDECVGAGGLVGVYVHGSAALGGFRSERSDVDMLVVVANPVPPIGTGGARATGGVGVRRRPASAPDHGDASRAGVGASSAPFEYAVLNACRALCFVADGTLRSKVAGGEWYLGGHPREQIVRAALARQRGDHANEPARDDVLAFVTPRE